MASYYCTDADITDLLPTLTGSQIASAAARNSRLRLPGSAWVDSVYPGVAPFPPMGVNDAIDWVINGEVASGALTASIDGGTGDPSVGDFFHPAGHNAFYKVTAYSAPTLTFQYVTNFNPGVNPANTTGAMAIIWDNTPLVFGAPYVLRQAAKWYAESLAYQILRNDPLNAPSAAALVRASEILGIKNGVARTNPFTYYADSQDGLGRLTPGTVPLLRG